MTNKEHFELLKRGADAWNSWRSSKKGMLPSLGDADLRGMLLSGFDFSNANLTGSRLYGSDLGRAVLCNASLADADLRRANLSGANLEQANLTGADLTGANLNGSRLTKANLDNADLGDAYVGNTSLDGTRLDNARLFETVFSDVDLSKAVGLEHCYHAGPSVVDHRTFLRSQDTSIEFWRGCGLPDRMIEYMPSLLTEAIQFFSCFISHSSKDQHFAQRLYQDLQARGVRCWFSPHDLPIGAKTWDGIDDAIRSRDKVILILSKYSIQSNWVEDEVNRAFKEEDRREALVLFPIRLDDSVMDAKEPWARKLRDQRNIGDFTEWEDPQVYRATFDRILRDLKPSTFPAHALQSVS